MQYDTNIERNRHITIRKKLAESIVLLSL